MTGKEWSFPTIGNGTFPLQFLSITIEISIHGDGTKLMENDDFSVLHHYSIKMWFSPKITKRLNFLPYVSLGGKEFITLVQHNQYGLTYMYPCRVVTVPAHPRRWPSTFDLLTSSAGESAVAVIFIHSQQYWWGVHTLAIALDWQLLVWYLYTLHLYCGFWISLTHCEIAKKKQKPCTI